MLKFISPISFFMAGVIATIIKLIQGAWPVSALIGFVIFLSIAIKHSR